MSQPIDEYPNPEMSSRQPDSSHSNGSFGPVFAVLAVIVVVSAVACVVGRLCGKRGHRVKEAAHQQSKGSKVQSGGLGPKEWESRQKPNFNMKNGDIEFGFDKQMPSGKEGKKGGGKPNKPHPNPPHQHQHQHQHQHKPEVRFSNNV